MLQNRIAENWMESSDEWNQLVQNKSYELKNKTENTSEIGQKYGNQRYFHQTRNSQPEQSNIHLFQLT